MANTLYNRTDIYTDIRGHKYVISQPLIEEAIKAWLQRQGMWRSLPTGSTWSFDWRGDAEDTDGIRVEVEHIKATSGEVSE